MRSAQVVTALSYFMISRSIIDDIDDIAAGVGLSDVETRVGTVLPMQDMLVGPVFFLVVKQFACFESFVNLCL